MRRILSSLAVLAAITGYASAQVAEKPAPGAAKAWTMPRTPDGKPDLQGVYSNATAIPVARPANLGAKEFYESEADKTATAAAAAAGGGRGGRGGAARPAAAADPEGNGLAVH